MGSVAFLLLILSTHCTGIFGNASVLSSPPRRPKRSSFTFEWCDCGSGIHNITLWSSEPNTVTKNNFPIVLNRFNNGPVWLDFQSPIDKVFFSCNGMRKVQTSTSVSPKRYWSVQAFIDRKKPFLAIKFL